MQRLDREIFKFRGTLNAIVKAPVLHRPLTRRESNIAFPPKPAFAVKKAKPGKPLQLSKAPKNVGPSYWNNRIDYACRILSRQLGREISPKDVLKAERKICFDKKGKRVMSLRLLRHSLFYYMILKRNL